MVAILSQAVSSAVAVPRAGAPASVRHCELGFASTLVLLSQFKHLMAYEGMDVDSALMRSDSNYAFAQLALGHTSTSEPLRQCAMRVFALFHA